MVTQADDLYNKDVYNMLASLREELLGWLLFPTGAASLYAVLILNLLLNREPFANISASFLIIGSCLLAYRLKARRPGLAAGVYIFGLAIAIYGLTWTLFTPVSTVLMPTLILVTITVLGSRSTLVVATLATLVILAAAEPHRQPYSAAVGPLAAVWLTFVVAWLSNLNRITAAEWAWNSYCQARAATDDARKHRAEVVRVFRALDEAYYRLERSNVQLARAREEAEQARRVKQQFVANVSHELRTPLNIIIGFSEALTLSPESYGVRTVPRQLMGDINRIYRSAGHLKRLIDDVLDLSQIDANHMPLITEQTNLSDAIVEATDMIRGIITRKSLRLILDIPPSLPPVVLDRLRVRQVLLNLLSNAVRFTDTGEITVSAKLHKDQVQVSVADTGPGIAPEDMERVFEEFQQLDVSLSKRYDGTGLGLALSRRFIELHGGRLWAESEVGQGSQFHFTLPFTPAAGRSNIAQRGSLPISAHVEARVGRTVLVTTEEPMAVNFLKRHLQGYQIRTVSDQDLAEAIETYLPHAVITNREFNHIESKNGNCLSSGWPATETKVPVITCPLPDSRYLSRTLGVDYYLVKPITRERLLDILAEYGSKINRILIIDDDVQLVELLARIVRAAPRAYTVDVACGGEEGLARMQEFKPDLVLLDLMMSELDGFSVLKLMRADNRLQKAAVILITARDLARSDLHLPHQNNISLEVPANLTTTEILNCLQMLLDSLPTPKLVLQRSSRPKLT